MAEDETLKQALERALESDDEGLVEAIRDARFQEVDDAAEAELLVQVLARFPVSVEAPERAASALDTALEWCRRAENRRAKRIFKRDAPAHLLRIFDALIEDAAEDAKLFHALMQAIAVMAEFEMREGLSRMLRAVQMEEQWGNLGWHEVYEVVVLAEKHAWVGGLIDALKADIPGGVIGILFLDLCSLQASTGQLREHPFKSPLGVQRLTSWLKQEDGEQLSFAESACVALHYLPESDRSRLLQLADESPNPQVRIAGAKARIDLEDESGIDTLREIGNDPRYAMGIIRFLVEHEAAPELFPERFTGSGSKTFIAKAQLCEWLTDPREFGRPPQKIQKIDSRKIYWPPVDEMRRVYLFRYEYPPPEGKKKPTVGIGMVGGATTFSLFGEVTDDMEPEEMYALHCAWELEMLQDKRAPKKRTVRAGLRILGDYNEGFDD